jgi:hypothetical protein
MILVELKVARSYFGLGASLVADSVSWAIVTNQQPNTATISNNFFIYPVLILLIERVFIKKFILAYLD